MFAGLTGLEVAILSGANVSPPGFTGSATGSGFPSSSCGVPGSRRSVTGRILSRFEASGASAGDCSASVVSIADAVSSAASKEGSPIVTSVISVWSATAASETGSLSACELGFAAMAGSGVNASSALSAGAVSSSGVPSSSSMGPVSIGEDSGRS